MRAEEGFTPDRAKRTAAVYVTNKAFANLEADGIQEHEETSKQGTTDPKDGDLQAKQSESGTGAEEKGGNEAHVLAQYSIPLGENEATIIFKGASLSADDFDALSTFVAFCKAQFERKSRVKTIPDTATTPAVSGSENSE